MSQKSHEFLVSRSIPSFRCYSAQLPLASRPFLVRQNSLTVTILRWREDYIVGFGIRKEVATAGYKMAKLSFDVKKSSQPFTEA
jgi:hypothetical protein